MRVWRAASWRMERCSQAREGVVESPGRTPARAVGPEVKGMNREETSGRQEIRRSAEPSQAAQDRLEQSVRVVDVEGELATSLGEPTGASAAARPGSAWVGASPASTQRGGAKEMEHLVR